MTLPHRHTKAASRFFALALAERRLGHDVMAAVYFRTALRIWTPGRLAS